MRKILLRSANAKPYFFLNVMNKKDLPTMYSIAFWCLFVVLLFFFWLYCVMRNHCYSFHKTKWRLVTSVWQGTVLDQSQQECRFFRRNSNPPQIFQLQPKREPFFFSPGDQLERRSIISLSNRAICAWLRGFRPVPVNTVALTNYFALWQLALTRRVQGLTFSQCKSLVDVSFPPLHQLCKC